MKIWNKWTTALYERERWISEFGYLPELQDIVTKLNNLGNNFTLDDLKVILNDLWTHKVPPCYECGKQDNEQEVLGIGLKSEPILVFDSIAFICLPCLVKALQMLDS